MGLLLSWTLLKLGPLRESRVHDAKVASELG